ncbi:MAG: hypothetical protein K9H61_11230 [Bacteroidia bacterium]|nr:hypothetical protein [Bacteroidia bacterium]MCF8425385.1 hypothetical protein [Bacteroidia bacterium]MCF8447559.1 hypothetical protein [Bacteroidia bacterium]
MSKPITLKYLSHGKQISGGYLHENYLCNQLLSSFGSNQIEFTECRQWDYFENPKQHLQLFWWAFKNGNADINVCVARLAIPVILRNLFNRNKVIVVWHYYDTYDGKSKSLRKWYHGLVNFSTWISKRKLAFVAVAPFWQRYFSEYYKLKQVFLFPNFFDSKLYSTYQKTEKKKQIHMGQVSFKNSNELFLLTEKLSAKGYACYFSTNDAEKVYQHACYEVRYFEKFEEYLKEMAASEYTLAMPFIREGWNRVAHESLLVGTQVIGFDKGGLGDLLRGANAFVVGETENELGEFYREQKITPNNNPIKQTLEIVLNQKQKEINRGFLDNYEVSETTTYLKKIVEWIK